MEDVRANLDGDELRTDGWDVDLIGFLVPPGSNWPVPWCSPSHVVVCNVKTRVAVLAPSLDEDRAWMKSAACLDLRNLCGGKCESSVEVEKKEEG